MARTLLLLLLLLLLCALVTLDPVQGRPVPGRQAHGHAQRAAADARDVYERGLVAEAVTAAAVLDQHDAVGANQSARHFGGTVLGYVTPWNPRGYTNARRFREKLTHVAPCWFVADAATLGCGSEHDVDAAWVAALRRGGRGPRICPRIVFEGWSAAQLRGAVSRADTFARSVESLCARHGFDGVVLDGLAGLGGAAAAPLVRAVAARLRQGGRRQLIFVVPPGFAARDAAALAPHVDHFSLNAYDHASGTGVPGPNAPLAWAVQAVRILDGGPKTLMGLAHYGYEWHTGAPPAAVTGGDYLELLRRRRPRIRWDADAREHVAEWRVKRARHFVYYPSLLSIAQRLAAAQELGVGVAIWELGQGLDYFFDLL